MDHTEIPTPELIAEHAAVLAKTNIPWGYRAAVAKAADAKRTAGARPSHARESWRFLDGIVNGYVNTVKELFGYFYYTHGEEVLKAAVELIERDREPARWPPGAVR